MLKIRDSAMNCGDLCSSIEIDIPYDGLTMEAETDLGEGVMPQISRNVISRRTMLATTSRWQRRRLWLRDVRLVHPSITRARWSSWVTTSSNSMPYDQVYYEPFMAQVSDRLDSNNESMRARIGEPQRAAYGRSEIEKLYIHRTNRSNAIQERRELRR